ncbi:MerR family DNA-binding transcriptional regulator [Noviherbaspirillum sp. CPCC 100848]|uniref:MerR family DNA-binding transcriptional regulator n=1 Tax=Noviherbaspirillum album TaxID=3080276 RepID=A0ABU6JJU9_9BURK|nr:MerR family DNA-binding transcriptional regulator [Noviherbaspirillum sp. CPCC 100848]MEC4723810.1 MerR family DNA-binding transcriptional regulator [Noviherbaspirillum sp. CPCC 100848]
MLLKIGELAKRSGVTIRALRHYDEIGLLSPSTRSEGGFRLYSLEDVGKLYRIQALSRLSLPLAEVQKVLAAGNATFPDIMEEQIAFLDHQISHAVDLRDHLVELRSRVQQSAALTMDDWVGALAQMSAVSRYFNDDERRALAARRASVDESCDKEKAAMTISLQQLMTEGVKADTDEAQELAYRWIQLLMAEVGGDEGLLMKYYTMQWNEDSLQLISGIDQAGMTYISHAMAYRRLKIYARYCTSDEIRSLRRHYIRHTTSWPPLIAAIRSHMTIGTDPKDPELQRLAREWTALESKKVGGDLALATKLQQAFMHEPALRFGSGTDGPFLSYLENALQALSNNPINSKTKDSA